MKLKVVSLQGDDLVVETYRHVHPVVDPQNGVLILKEPRPGQPLRNGKLHGAYSPKCWLTFSIVGDDEEGEEADE